MLPCPSPLSQEQLGRLLSGELAEAEQSDLSSHIETCEPCRAALERLAAQSGLWDALTLLRDDEEDTDIDADWSIPGLFEPPEEDGQIGILGPYAILETIGRGGMGVVFLARDRTLDRLVAIKLMSPHLAASPSARRRFAREARAAAAVVHEHVVTIHAVDVSPRGIPYLVMQYVAGKSAQDLVDGFDTRRPAIEEILRIGSQVAWGLAAAHEQGLIHRDVKPGNILLENGVERVKLTDFGLARAADDAAMTQTGLIAGTPQYMSPEQARGDALDPRTDLFSLGSVLYALATGRPPFRSRSSLATLKVVCEQEPEPIARLRPDLPPWFSAILKRLHAKEPDGRHASAAELAELLTRCLAHVRQPDRNPLPAELAPPRRSPKRRRLAAAIALGALTLLAASPALPAVRDAAERFAILLRIKTPEGTLVVETDDPAIGITLDDSKLTVTGGVLRELKIPVGPHRVRATKDGQVLKEELVHIEKNGKTVLSVRREADAAENAQASATWPNETTKTVDSMMRLLTGTSTNETPLPRRDTKNAQPPGRTSSLYLKDLAFGWTRPLTTDLLPADRIVRMSDWSRDGKRLAITSMPPEGSSLESRVLLVELHDGGRFNTRNERLTIRDLGLGLMPSFSPDGTQLAVAVFKGMSAEEEGVYIIDAEDQRRRRVRELGQPDWSPDGKRLLINGFRDQFPHILDLQSDQYVTVQAEGFKTIRIAKWSGPSTIIALATNRENREEVIELDVTRPDRATFLRRVWLPPTAFPHRPRWLSLRPQADSLLVVGEDHTSDRRLYEVRNNPSLDPKEFPSPTPSSAPGSLCISPDGRYLLFTEADKVESKESTITTPVAPPSPGSDEPPPKPDFRPTAARIQSERLANALMLNSEPATSSSSPGGDVYIRNLRTGRTRRILGDQAGSGRIDSPEWSRDGSQFAFEQMPGPNDAGNITSYRAQVCDGEVDISKLLDGVAPSFSPDGKRAAMLVSRPQLNPPRQFVAIWGADRSQNRLILRAGRPRWSPRGNRILITSHEESTKQVVYWIYDLDSNTEERIHLDTAQHRGIPQWTGENTFATIVQLPGGGLKLPEFEIQEFDISQPRSPRVVRTFGPQNDLAGFFKPFWILPDLNDGSIVVLGALPGARCQLIRIPQEPNKRPVQNLPQTAAGESIYGACLSPDGNFLVYCSLNANGVSSKPERTVVPTTPRPAPAPAVTASPEEKKAAARIQSERLANALMLNSAPATSSSQPRGGIYLKNLRTGRTRRILAGYPEVHGLTSPDWSRDGSRIAFENLDGLDEEGRRSAARIRLRDGEFVMDYSLEGMAPSFSPDGRRVAMLVSRPQLNPPEHGIRIYNSDHPQNHWIPRAGNPRWSPTGNRLLITSDWTHISHSCWVVNLDTNEEQRVAFPEDRFRLVVDSPVIRSKTLMSVATHYPQWTGEQTIAAVVMTPEKELQIVEFDISQPNAPRVVDTLWKQSEWPGFIPRFLLPNLTDRSLIVVGLNNNKATQLLQIRRFGPARTTNILEDPAPGTVARGACLSPDGNFLLYCASNQATTPAAAWDPDVATKAKNTAPAPSASAKPAPSQVEKNAAIRREVERLAGAIMDQARTVIRDDGKSGTHVYLRDLRDGRTRQVFEAFDEVRRITAPDWSRDGSQIAFEVTPDLASRAYNYRVKVQDGQVDIGRVFIGRSPSFSPDGERLAVSAWFGDVNPSRQGMLIVGADRNKTLAVPTQGIPRWSPDKDRILGVSGDPNQGFACAIYDLGTKAEDKVAFGDIKIRSLPQWSGPHTLVAVVEVPSKGLQIQEFDVSQPKTPRVVATYWPPKNEVGFTPTTVLPDPMNGGLVVLGTRQNKVGTMFRILGGADGPRIIAIPGPDTGTFPHGACLSPDGNYLLYCEITQPDAARPEPAVKPGAKLEPAEAAERLVEAMGRRPVTPTTPGANRMQIYLRDMQDGTTRLVLDEPEPGLTAVAFPDWSKDGTRVAFWGAPQGDYGRGRVLVLGLGEGQARINDLGPGGAPAWSPDGKRIAFRIDGLQGGQEAGTWVMNADGTNRVRLTSEGAPAWSPDGKFLLINSYDEATRSWIYSFETGKETALTIPDHVIRSWPRWSAPGRLIAVLSRLDAGPVLVEIDVTDPSKPVVEKPLWQQHANVAGLPRWPTFLKEDEIVMVNTDGSDHRRLCLLKGRQFITLDPLARRDQLSGLTASPGGRYLMFNANRDDRK